MSIKLEIQGRVIQFDNMPTEQEIDEVAKQFGGQRTQATEEEFLPTKERLKGGFRRPEQLTQVREKQRLERGLAPGTPLEPTGLNLRNLLDLPADVADMVGPAFPIVGAAIGGTAAGAAALPTGGAALLAVAKGGAIGGAGGQLLRQRIGGLMGYEQGTAIQQLGDIATEGAFGAAQELGGVFIGRAINSTKLGMLRTADKMLKKLSPEGFTKGWGSIATHVDKAKVQFALDAVRRGDKRVLTRVFADKDFADKFARKLFFGEDGNLAKQLFKLSHRKGAKGAIRDLYREFLDIGDDVFETLYQKGSSINKFNNPNVILKLGQDINKGLDDLFTNSGKALEIARTDLASKAGNVSIGDSLSRINLMLADDLSKVGFLLKEGDGLFSINPSFPATSTGSAQAKMFGQLVARFFGSEGDDVLIRAAQRGDVTAIQKLADLSSKASRKGRRGVFNVINDIKYKDFAGKLGSLDVQISGNEFKALGRLSPALAQYLEGLRTIPIAIEQKLGGSEVRALTVSFREFAEGAKLLRQGTKIRNPGQIEKALQRLAKAEPGTAAAAEAKELNTFLQKNLKINFLDDLRSFKAAQTIKEINRTFGDERVRQRVVSVMKNAFNEDVERPIVKILKTRTDPFLPNNLKIGEFSEIHTVANALHRDAASLLRGRFLYNALIGPMIGGGLGGMLGGPGGATAGVAIGLGLQHPGILRFLIKESARLSLPELRRMAAKGMSPFARQAIQKTPATARLLQQLIQQR